MNDKTTNLTNGYVTTNFNGSVNSNNCTLNDNNSINSSSNTVPQTNFDALNSMDDIETMLANLSTQLDAMLTQGKN